MKRHNRKQNKNKTKKAKQCLLFYYYFFPQQTNKSAALKHGMEGETERNGNDGRDEATESERERR